MPSFKIRLATPKDLDLLVQHRHMMFDEMSKPSAKAHEAGDKAYRKWAKEMMSRGLLRGYVVAAQDGKAAASGCVWLRDVQPSPERPSGRVPYVLSVYTRPEFRRNGLASMVMAEAADWARRNGYHKLVLHASTTGRKVYSQLGWKRTWEMEFRFDRPEAKPKVRHRPARRPSIRARASK